VYLYVCIYTVGVRVCIYLYMCVSLFVFLIMVISFSHVYKVSGLIHRAGSSKRIERSPNDELASPSVVAFARDSHRQRATERNFRFLFREKVLY